MPLRGVDCHPDHGVELVSQTDMFAAEPSGRVIRMDSMPMPERHRIHRWQILIAAAGTLGETELFGGRHCGCAPGSLIRWPGRISSDFSRAGKRGQSLYLRFFLHPHWGSGRSILQLWH